MSFVRLLILIGFSLNSFASQDGESPEIKVWSGFQAVDPDIPSGIEVQSGLLDYVVCIEGSLLNVRDESLNQVLFTVARYTSAKPVQSFGTDRLKKVIDGVEYTFIKVDFPTTSNPLKIGWVAEKYILPRNQCVGAAQQPTTPTTPTSPPITTGWTFPTIQRPSSSYKEAQRRFGAARSGGRLHAACDLYRVTNEQAVAINAGSVIRDKYYFYEGTYALEIKHTDGKVARYGEITGQNAPNVSVGKSVSSGQVIGYIGKVNSGCCTPMLHFELYKGTMSGALTQGSSGYQRRQDLMDPTFLLMDWEKLKFGESY